MVSVWWLVLAVLMGAYAGALLVGLMAINAGNDDREEEAIVADADDEDVRLVA
ncbi:MAG: hypothetical protein ABI920_14270 [Casimicrobiaceae bacterium]